MNVTRFFPPSGVVGQGITITARVANYSFVETSGIQVTFYQGEPRNGGLIIGSPYIINSLQPRQRQNVTQMWTPPSFDSGTVYRIYVTLAPTDKDCPFAGSQGYGLWPPPSMQASGRERRVRLSTAKSGPAP